MNASKKSFCGAVLCENVLELPNRRWRLQLLEERDFKVLSVFMQHV